LRVSGATGVLVHVQGGGYGSREHLFGGRPPTHHGGSKLHTSASSVSCESCSSRELADPPSTSSEEKGQIFRQVHFIFISQLFFADPAMMESLSFQTAHTSRGNCGQAEARPSKFIYIYIQRAIALIRCTFITFFGHPPVALFVGSCATASCAGVCVKVLFKLT
jgi:hypothetical protein